MSRAALGLGLLGLVSVPFPQLLGNGRDVSELAFNGALTAPLLLLCLVVLKPVRALHPERRSGGLFTPSLTFGALLDAGLGVLASAVVPGVSVGLSALLGAGGLLAATTQGPISATVLLLELSNRDWGIIAPLLLAVITATLISCTLEPRSIYDARLDPAQARAKRAAAASLPPPSQPDAASR